MSEEVKLSIPTVTVADLEKLAARIKRNTGNDQTEVGFEFIIASLFPTCWRNIQIDLNRQYTMGYIQGKQDAESETRLSNIEAGESDCYSE